MNLEELIVRLRIEEGNKKFDKKSGGQFGQEKANIVESSSKINKKIKHFGDALKKDNKMNAKKFKDYCYNGEKAGHRASECCKPKKQKAQTNVIESDISAENIKELNLSAVVSECNNIENPRE
ncbi:Retrovirus-related Pol polyprotein from transposon TNT 1-94 [Abeliophyllum distichum]|uniref:Retrovirus-related Pol polyprotein from transposon TNT 1-94 n=1 Tax=Abeliophyllum distichum TaxID=126358 RepID=A0ABD1SAK6_9LAMI